MVLWDGSKRRGDHHISASGFRGDEQLDDCPVLHFTFNHGLPGGVKFEVHIPLFRPSGKEADFFSFALHEHILEGGLKDAGVILIRCPIVIRTVETGEAMTRRLLLHALQNHGLHCRRQPEHRGLNGVLMPPDVFLETPGVERINADLQIFF